MLTYCLIKKNKLYQDLYSYIESEELVMNNPNHTDLIKDNIKKFINKADYITISDKFGTTDTLFENMLETIIIDNNEESCNEKHDIGVNNQGNTLLSYCDSSIAYEIIYTEFFNSEITNDENNNQFASISNIELSPIYGSCGILKTVYNNGLQLSSITKNDIYNLLINIFYHSGVLLHTDGTMKDLVFSGEDPCFLIGSSFKIQDPIQILGLTFVYYVETDSKNDNKIASMIFGKELKGRVYIALLCPITNKKFNNITIKELNELLEILKDNDKVLTIEKELLNDKITNPFFIINKYK
jgi:hypothetical protein